MPFMGEHKDVKIWGEEEGQVATKDRSEVREPPLYQVFLINDDFTPMDFVVMVIESIFHKSHEEATRIMLDVHRKGLGVCGLYPYDIARTKVLQVRNLAQKNGHPLECDLEAVVG